MFAQHALDRIERTRSDGHVARWNALGLELGGSEGDERPEFERLSVRMMNVSEALKMRSELRQQLGIGVTRREINRARERLAHRRSRLMRLRSPSHMRAATAATGDETARMQEAIRRCNRDWTDAQRRGQLSDRREPSTRPEGAGVDGLLHRRRDFGRRRTSNSTMSQYLSLIHI